MYRIMICEDDFKLSELLRECVEKYGFHAHVVENFEHVLQEFTETSPHLVLLDVNLPKYDGFYWCRQIRKVSKCPILFISARSGEMDQVMALEYGADDYVTKPIQIEVMVAKIKSQLRRVYGEYASQTEEIVIRIEGLTLFPERLELHFGEAATSITHKESLLVEALLHNYPRVATREELLVLLWDDLTYVDENTLNVNVTRVRKKLQEIGLIDGIETIRGVGYRIRIQGGGEDGR